ncbi:MAG: sporulation protein YqfD, partial [Ruminococcus sp.]|nr:sporulation protein YqfD [Ruminococcus sp.]
MLLNGIRFIKGTVRFRVSGKSPERLLNLAAQRGVLLWNAHPTAQGMEGETAARDYRRLRPLARQAGV